MFSDRPRLSGDEAFHEAEDWFKELINGAEIVLPGADRALRWALDQPEPITAQQMVDIGEPQFSNLLSRDLHGLLYNKNDCENGPDSRGETRCAQRP